MQRSAHSWRWLALASACAVACSGLVAAGRAQAKPSVPFFAIHQVRIPVPKQVGVAYPEWSPDGRRILFENVNDGTIWTAARTGKGVRCLTCGQSDRPSYEGFYYPFPDNRRLWLNPTLGGTGGVDSGQNADGVILECAPSLYDCRTHKYLAVDMSEDRAISGLVIQRRTWHLAPDGVHVGWMEVRANATLMIVGKLQRQADRYTVIDERIVNPPGPSSPTDTSPGGWANVGQLYELKSFADGGRSILAVAERQGTNADVIKINLATGRTTQLTHNADWDEDGAISPDGKLYELASWRTRHRLDAFGWIPELPPFTSFPLAAAGAVQYVSTWPGFQCDLSPWLLPAGGDAGGSLIGQPLNTYAGEETAGNNLIGQQMWSPDSTEVLIHEKLRTRPPADANTAVQQAGLSPSRILVDRIARRPTRPVPIVSSTVGDWAPTPAAYHDPFAAGVNVTIDGSGGGTAHLVVTGNVIGGGTWSVTFNRYSADGRTFLNGTQSVTFGATVIPLHVDAAVTVSGQHTGSLNANLTFDNGAQPVPTHSGTYAAVYDGKTAPALPNVGPCYGKLPRPSRLRLSLERSGRSVQATVTANVDGDVRPVQGATVSDGRESMPTDVGGRAVLRRIHGRRARVTATAGQTFLSATRIS